MTDADVDDEPGFRRRKVSRTALRKLRARESERVKAAKPPLASPPALPTACALSLPDNDASSGGGDDSNAPSLAAPAAPLATGKRLRGPHVHDPASVRVG